MEKIIGADGAGGCVGEQYRCFQRELFCFWA